MNSEKTQDNLQVEKRSAVSGNFAISGAYALYPLVRKWADDFMEFNPGVKIEVTKTGTTQGITDRLAKRNQLVMISRPLNDTL